MLEKARENAVDRHLKEKLKGKAMIEAEATIETMMKNLPKMHTKVKRKEAPEAVALAKAKAKARVNPEAHLSDLVARVRAKAKAKLTAADHLLKVKAKVKEVRNHVRFFAKGICTHGDKCWNSHEGGSAQANAASANPANTEPKPKKNKKKTLYGTPAKSSGAVAIMIAAVASCIQTASGFVGSCVISNPIMHLNQSMLLEQPQGCVSKVGRKGPIVFDTDHSIVEFEVDHEMWKYGEHENCTDRQMFGADEAYKMVAASSEKDHYLAFKRAKKLAKYIYKNVCSAAFSFTRPNIVTPVAWLSDTGASCDLIGKEYVDPVLLDEMTGKAEKPVTLNTANGNVPRLDTTVLCHFCPSVRMWNR